MSSEDEAGWHDHYHLINIITPICFTYTILLAIIQIYAVKWCNNKYNTITMNFKSVHAICVFGVYFAQIICGIQCFLMHISHDFNSKLFCFIGTPICTIIYGGARCFLYGVWLERAKTIQNGYISFMPKIIYNKLLPIYIAVYYTLQVIIIATFFRGKLIADNNNEITSCHFDEWVEWVPILATIADGLNSICFTLLFVYPLYRNMKNCIIRDEFKNHTFNKLIKLNITFTAICSISSMSTIVIIADPTYLVPLFIEYLWFITNIDMVINATSVFILFAPNRQFIKYMICCGAIDKQSDSTKSAKRSVDIVKINTAMHVQMAPSIDLESPPITPRETPNQTPVATPAGSPASTPRPTETDIEQHCRFPSE